MTNREFNGVKKGQLNLIVGSSGTGKSKCVRLLPNTMRLKQLIKEHGFIWKIESGPDPKQCFANAEGFLIESLDGQHTRNIRTTDLEFFK
jgi:energy-coupling factor transporter ATP-binding protein EcfA2